MRVGMTFSSSTHDYNENERRIQSSGFSMCLYSYPRRADPDSKCVGELPLCVAATTGDLEFLEIIISASADIDKKNDKGLTPLALALTSFKAEAVEFLCVHNCKVPRIFSRTQRERLIESG